MWQRGIFSITFILVGMIAVVVQGCEDTVIATTQQSINTFLSNVDLPIFGYDVSFSGRVDTDNLAFYRNLVLHESSFPSVTFFGNLTESFDAIKIADAGLTPQDISTIAQDVNQMVVSGACIAKVQYDSSAGGFNTYAVAVGDQLGFEALQYLIPTLDMRQEEIEEEEENQDGDGDGGEEDGETEANEDGDGDGNEEEEQGEGEQNNLSRRRNRLLRHGRFMLQSQYESNAQSGRFVWVDSGIDVMEFNCFVTADCREKEALACTGTLTANSLFIGWEANGVKDVIKVGDDCCRNTCTFGWAFGFKRVEVSVDKVSVEIEGILGAGGTFGRTAKACCERECPTASPTAAPTESPSDMEPTPFPYMDMSFQSR